MDQIRNVVKSARKTCASQAGASKGMYSYLLFYIIVILNGKNHAKSILIHGKSDDAFNSYQSLQYH